MPRALSAPGGARRLSSAGNMCGALEASAAAQAQGTLPNPEDGMFTDLMGIAVEPVYFKNTPAGASAPCCAIM